MPEQAHGPDFAIWVVAAVLYVVDAARLTSPRQAVLAESGAGAFDVALSEDPFTLAGRPLVWSPLLRPDRGVFVASWGTRFGDPETLSATLASIESLRASLLPVRIVAVSGFVMLFGLGPVLTRWLGPDAAVLYTAAVLYPTVLAGIAVLWWRRGRFRLGAGRCAALTLEILVCPAFLPNLVRKITGSLRIEADAVQIVLATGSPAVQQAFVDQVMVRAERMMDESHPDDAAQHELRAYVAAVKAAR